MCRRFQTSGLSDQMQTNWPEIFPSVRKQLSSETHAQRIRPICLSVYLLDSLTTGQWSQSVFSSEVGDSTILRSSVCLFSPCSGLF